MFVLSSLLSYFSSTSSQLIISYFILLLIFLHILLLSTFSSFLRISPPFSLIIFAPLFPSLFHLLLFFYTSLPSPPPLIHSGFLFILPASISPSLPSLAFISTPPHSSTYLPTLPSLHPHHPLFYLPSHPQTSPHLQRRHTLSCWWPSAHHQSQLFSVCERERTVHCLAPPPLTHTLVLGWCHALPPV